MLSVDKFGVTFRPDWTPIRHLLSPSDYAYLVEVSDDVLLDATTGKYFGYPEVEASNLADLAIGMLSQHHWERKGIDVAMRDAHLRARNEEALAMLRIAIQATKQQKADDADAGGTPDVLW